MSVDLPLMTFAGSPLRPWAGQIPTSPSTPRASETPGPHALASLASLELLLGMFPVAVARKINRPTVRHHPTSEVAPERGVGAVSILAGGRNLAARHDPTIAVRTPMRNAGHRLRSDQLGKVQGRNLAAPVGLPRQRARLPTLGGVDAPYTDSLAVDFERVTVDH